MKGRTDDAGPQERHMDPSKLVDAILALLEEAGAPQDVCDVVVRTVETWEFSQIPSVQLTDEEIQAIMKRIAEDDDREAIQEGDYSYYDLRRNVE